jgi:hypothetical protein
MSIPEKGHLLRIFVNENRHYEHMPLYEWIVRKAHAAHLTHATVTRGMMGFNANTPIHTARILSLSEDLPVVIEIVDALEKIDAFLPQIEHAIDEGLVTVEDVQVRFYRKSKSP